MRSKRRRVPLQFQMLSRALDPLYGVGCLSGERAEAGRPGEDEDESPG